jgi:hypothetical protein
VAAEADLAWEAPLPVPGTRGAGRGAPPLWLAETPHEHSFRMAELPAEKALYVQLNEIGRFAEESLGDSGKRVGQRADWQHRTRSRSGKGLKRPRTH